MKNKIKKLAEASYTNGALDTEIVFDIAKKLNRAGLKKYIKALKAMERKKSVFVEVAQNPQQFDFEKLRHIFPEKHIVVKLNPKLLLGARIIDNDIVYDTNLQNSLENFLEQINE